MPIGGIPPYPGANNTIIGTPSSDDIYGDPFTTGAPSGPQVGGTLSSGRGGDDWLQGRGGDDSIYGDAYKMDGVGQGGNDRLDGGLGDDLLVGDADQMAGNSKGGNDILDAGSGNDEVYGDARFLLEHSRGGNDVIYGGGGRDYVAGDSFYLVDFAVGGNDRIFGGAGDDFSLVGDARGLFNDAQGGDDRLDGGAGDDYLAGDADTMRDNASGGDDFLVGGAGNDELYGDAETYTDFTGVGGADRFYFDIGSGQDRIGDFEVGKDLIQIAHAYGFRSFAELQSRISDDQFGNAVVHLSATDQVTLLGVSSAELSAADFLFSDEVIRGSSGNNTMTPTSAVLAYRTSALNDTVLGLGGNDVIDGGGGADTMKGGTGNDTYFVDSYSEDGIAGNDDRVVELAGEGRDLVNASVSYRLADEVENLTLTGTAAIDGTGNSLANVITGNAGANTLAGGLGRDTLEGGGDGDRFVFNLGDTSKSAASLDTIVDFATGQDVIDLDVVQGALSPTSYAEASIATNNYADAIALAQSMVGGGQTVAFVAGSTDGWLFWDAGGDGTIDQAIMLKGVNTLNGFAGSDVI